MRLFWGEWLPRATFFALGYVPITALGVSLLGWVPLWLSSRFVVLPALILTIALGLWNRRLGKLALLGFVAGLLATSAYDVTRLTLVWAGLWPDFIPSIGRLALHDQSASAFWGYLWRFAGNGGGMGMAFAMLPRVGTRLGMLYGEAICGCLFLVLLINPHAQHVLFPLTPATIAAAMIGHLDYGGTLGWFLTRWIGREPAAAERVVPAATPSEAPR